MKYIERIAFVLALISTLIYFHYPQIAPYLLALGAAGLCSIRWRERYEGKNVRLKRIIRIRHLIGLIWLAASYFMFKPGNYWLVAIFIAVVLELYTIQIFEHESKKEKKS